jgi:hypothetical protein
VDFAIYVIFMIGRRPDQRRDKRRRPTTLTAMLTKLTKTTKGILAALLS